VLFFSFLAVQMSLYVLDHMAHIEHVVIFAELAQIITFLIMIPGAR